MQARVAVELPGFSTCDTLYEGGRSRIYTCTRKGDPRPLVVKLTPSIAELRQELELGRRAAGPLVCEVLEIVPTSEGPALLERRFGDVTLRQALAAGPLPVERVLSIGLQIARALEHVHSRRIVHRDVNPTNVLLDSASGAIALGDFGIAIELPIGARRLPVLDMVGTAHYMAPEQTGRIQEGADARSDLYSLGATLYEMLTGGPPFPEKDLLEVIAAQLSRLAEAPQRLVPGIPPVLSALVMKLLAKSTGERYQSARGVAEDLARCIATRQPDGAIPDFALGSSDTLPLPRPARLFGREAESRALATAFAGAEDATSSLLTLVGKQGSGRETLVRSFLRSSKPAPHWAFGAWSGRTERPLAAIVDALSCLVDRLLLLDERALGAVRNRIAGRLGAIGQVLVEIAAPIENLLGPQAEVPVLPPLQAAARLHLAFRRLLEALAEETGFVLALDGYEHADSASRALIEGLLEKGIAGKLLIVLTAADAQALPAAPRARSHTIELLPLPVEAVCDWIQSSLAVSAEAAAPLAQVIHDKSDGTPAVIAQLLEHLVDEGVVHRADERWVWSLDEVRGAPPPAALGALAAERIDALAADLRAVLEGAVCCAIPVDSALLAVVVEREPDQVALALAALERIGLLSHSGTSYVIAHRAITDAVLSNGSPELRKRYLGRLAAFWLETLAAPEREARAFQIATALLHGERAAKAHRVGALAVLSRAGSRSMSATAYDTALSFFELASSLLEDDDWTAQRQLAVTVATGRGRCLGLLGQVDAAEDALAAVCARDLAPFDLATVYGNRCVNFLTVLRRDRAVEVGLEGLARLGVVLPLQVPKTQVQRAVRANQRRLSKLTPQSLVSQPAATNERDIAILDLLGRAGAAAFFTNPDLYALIIQTGIERSLRYGAARTFAHMLGSHASVLVGAMKQYSLSLPLLEAVEKLLELGHPREFASRAMISALYLAGPLFRDLRLLAAQLARGVDLGLEAGELVGAALCAIGELILLGMAGAELGHIDERCQAHLRSGARGEAAVMAYMKLVGNLSGKAARGEALTDVDLDPFLALPRAMRSIRNDCMVDTAFTVIAAGHEDRVRAWIADIRDDFERVNFASPNVVLLRVFEAIFAARDAAAGGDAARLAVARKALRELKQRRDRSRAAIGWAVYLVEAEIARARGNAPLALDLYGRATADARSSRSQQVVAFALERRAELLRELGREDEAWTFLVEAFAAYQRWGHALKVSALLTAYPGLDTRTRARKNDVPRTIGEGTGDFRGKKTTINDELDLGTVLQVSREISTQLKGSAVVETVLRGVAQNAGADRALLIVRDDDGSETVYGELSGGQYRDAGIPLEKYTGLPDSILRMTRRSRRPVVVNDAREDPSHASDPFVIEQRCRSVACIPLLRRGSVAGFAILENRLIASAFTAQAVALTSALMAQAEVSLHNAALYESLDRRVQERTFALARRNDEMRLVLDNVSQGLVLADRNGTLSAERSRALDTWFDHRLPKTLLELCQLDSDGAGPWFELCWEQLLDGILPIELALEQLPKRLAIKNRVLELQWQPVSDQAGELQRMLLVLSDITQRIEREQTERAQTELLSVFTHLTRDREGLIGFCREASAMVAEIREGRSSLEVEKRLLHTLKGNAGLFGLQSISALCHSLESTTDQASRPLLAAERELLADTWSRAYERFRRFLALGEGYLHVHRQDHEAALARLRREGHPLSEDLERWLLEPSRARLERVAEQARAIAERLGKSPLKVEIEDGSVRLDSETWGGFWSGLIHAVRNAIAHGFEPPSERALLGKGAATLRLSTRVVGDTFMLELSDDGRGIDWDKIREKATCAGLRAETMDDLVAALFAQGISTAESVDDISGRGVGMAALADSCSAMGGTLSVESERGRGTAYRFVFPRALAHVRWSSPALRPSGQPPTVAH
jgi:predicted ATPase/HPt (histidine-containing phosphotransfer) domain-containing protein